MSNVDIKKLLTNINNLNIDEETKKSIANKLDGLEQLDNETLSWVRMQIQNEFEKAFSQLGLDEENDPDLKAANDQMNADLKAVEENYNATTDALVKGAKVINEVALDAVNKIDIQAAKDQVADV